MDITILDTSATQGTSWLHRCAPAAKLAAFALMVVAIASSVNVLVVASIAACLLAVATSCRLPAGPLLALSAYPGVFAALFAFAAGVDALGAALIVGRAVTAALAAVVLMLTTPYPQVFAPIQRLVPPVVGDAILMTYRSLFLLVDKFASTMTAVRLRSGLNRRAPLRSASAVSRTLGGVLLYSVDLSQRTHDIMYLRGYDGRLVVSARSSDSIVRDVALVTAAAVVMGGAWLWRTRWAELNPYAWLPLASALIAVLLTLATTLLRKAAR